MDFRSISLVNEGLLLASCNTIQSQDLDANLAKRQHEMALRQEKQSLRIMTKKLSDKQQDKLGGSMYHFNFKINECLSPAGGVNLGDMSLIHMLQDNKIQFSRKKLVP